MFKAPSAVISFALVASLVSFAGLQRELRPAGAASQSLYSTAQATAGKKLYATNCASCHAADLSGAMAPPLKGAIAPFHGTQSVSEVYDYISGQMPLNNPGGLPATTYASILAYILQQNGHPAGTAPLTPASAKKIETKV